MAQNSLQKLYPEQRIRALAAEVAAKDLAGLARRWRLPPNVGSHGIFCLSNPSWHLLAHMQRKIEPTQSQECVFLARISPRIDSQQIVLVNRKCPDRLQALVK